MFSLLFGLFTICLFVIVNTAQFQLSVDVSYSFTQYTRPLQI
uniref:Uncharacterized protein n=1 Tax=Arundo donax TaxID=35708 RepID=A0A0A9EWJ0_ARUDO